MYNYKDMIDNDYSRVKAELEKQDWILEIPHTLIYNEEINPTDYACFLSKVIKDIIWEKVENFVKNT